MTAQAEYSYDLFISYAQADQEWVKGYLLDALEMAGIVYHSEEAFALGVPRLVEFERAVKASRRTLLVLSPAYLTDEFNQFVNLLAQAHGLEAATWPVIPLILHPVQLPTRLAMLTRLDGADPGKWGEILERLSAELQRAVPGPAPRPRCPYPGMRAFTEAEGESFCGRDAEIELLLRQLRRHPFVAVIGPSGSGKSSLVFAGLLPRLRKSHLFEGDEWRVDIMRPGEEPLIRLRSLRLEEGSQREGTNLLLIVDQFEETFTLAGDEAEPFQDALLDLIQAPGIYLILTVRADFYRDLMESLLWSEIQAHRLEVPRLDVDGLRQAIVRPAENAGVFVEPTLVERLVADAVGEPGILPFVQETLVLMWDRLERRFLPLRAYESLVGDAVVAPRTGLQVAMAEHADQTLRELASQSPKAEALARRTFLRLIQFGEGRADTRRQQPLSALRAAGDDPQLFDQTLHHLTDNRLLTLSGEEGDPDRRVDIAHEALIDGWPTLKEWLHDRKDAEQTRRRLEAKTQEWEQLERKGGLLDRVELPEAERWLIGVDAADLGYDEALPALVKASGRAQRRSVYLRLGALGAIVVLIIGVLTAILLGQVQVAEEQRKAARISLAQSLAASAPNTNNDDELTTLLAIEAVNLIGESPGSAGWLIDSALRGVLSEPYFVNTLRGHEDAVSSVTFSPGGRWLASGSDDRTVRLWNMNDLSAAPHVLSAHEERVSSLAFSPDGRWLASGSFDHTVQLWDMNNLSAAPRVLGTHEDRVWSVAFSPDGRWLASGSSDRTVRLWNTQDLQAAPRVLSGHEEDVWSVAFSPDGRWLASASAEYVYGGGDSAVRLWDMHDLSAEARVLSGHEFGAFSVAFSPDGRWLASGSGDMKVLMWNMDDLSAPPRVLSGGYGEPAFTLAFSPDGRWLASPGHEPTGLSGAVWLWDLDDPSAEAHILSSPKGSVGSVAFSPDGQWLASGNNDNTVRLWDIKDPPAAPRLLSGNEEDVWPAAFNPYGQWLASGSWDGLVHLWNMGDLAATPRVLNAHDAIVTSVAFSPEGRWLASGSWDGTARLWDFSAVLNAGGLDTAPHVLSGHAASVLSMAFSPDGQWLASGSDDGMVRLWDVSVVLNTGSSDAALRVLSAHERRVTSVSFSPDGQWLASSSWDGTARLWNVSELPNAGGLDAAPRVLSGQDGISSVAFSLDGRWLALGGGDGTVRLWDVSTVLNTSLSEMANLPDSAEARVFSGQKGEILSVAFSPDGRRLASSSYDLFDDSGTVWLWDIDGPEAGHVLSDHKGMVRSVAFSPDGRWLASGSHDGTVQLWIIPLDDLAEIGCSKVRRNMTRTEWDFYLLGQPYRKTCEQWPEGE